MSRNRGKRKSTSSNVVAIDVFCGAGGLTRGLLDAGIKVVAGYDIDEACKYPFEHNNPGADFFKKDVKSLTGRGLAAHYPKNSVRVLVGCAPCTPFTKYTWGNEGKSGAKWALLKEFGRLIRELRPDIVSMENVSQVQQHTVFRDFLKTLRSENYFFSEDSTKWLVHCPSYGMPQRRLRLVLLASRFGPIKLQPPMSESKNWQTVRSALSGLPKLDAGEACRKDGLHRSASLTKINLRRIRASKPGSSWREWPDELIASCHRKKEGKTYPSVYGRMSWDEPSPTITTQFYGFGNGRFGHPEQNRALSLREGAILQTFPKSYRFVPEGGNCSFKRIGRMIGNAVPVRLGEVIGQTIKDHIVKYAA